MECENGFLNGSRFWGREEGKKPNVRHVRAWAYCRKIEQQSDYNQVTNDEAGQETKMWHSIPAMRFRML